MENTNNHTWKKNANNHAYTYMVCGVKSPEVTCGKNCPKPHIKTCKKMCKKYRYSPVKKRL
jgi:hypothetical protein